MSTFPAISQKPNTDSPNATGIPFFVIAAALISVFAATVSVRDSLSYWAAGKQLVHRANPYDFSAIAQLEDAAGFKSQPGFSFIMRNPPYSLPLVLPLGFFGPKLAGAVWSLLLLCALVYSVRSIWIMHGRPNSRIHYIGYFFGPALGCLLTGQAAIFALLGLVLFLRFHRTNPVLAGVALWLCSLKPHIFLPFFVVLLLWSVVHRSYTILLGAAAAMGATTLATFVMDPSIWSEYRQMMHASGIENEFIPCWGVALRLWLRPGAMWIQFLPSVLACAWASVYFWRRRNSWNWIDQGSVLMLVSVLAAPYSWFFDQCVLLPALLNSAYRATSRTAVSVLVLASSAVIVLIFAGSGTHSAAYLWFAPTWLAWHLWSNLRVSNVPKRHARN